MPTDFPVVFLKKGKDAALLRFHPWVFSGAVLKVLGEPKDGDTVDVLDHQGQWLALGHYQEGSIMVRLLSWERQAPDLDFWVQRLGTAWQVRRQAGLHTAQNNAYRLVHAEGDGLPGLIIDYYAGMAVVQCHSIGMHRQFGLIAEALKAVMGEALWGIYDKSKETLPFEYATQIENRHWLGEAAACEIVENGQRFRVDWVGGQKTGFFLDQRDNRALVAHYAKGKRVLNTFCYSGGFSVYALAAGAAAVTSVDASQKAMDLTAHNVALNGHEAAHTSITDDVLHLFKQHEARYDVLIVDPPAFAKSLKKRHNAVQGYKRLNMMALERVAPGGVLFTFSCSQVIDRQLFYDTLVAAAIETKRRVRVLHRLSQPADHPVSIYHPEGAYLKGYVLHVE